MRFGEDIHVECNVVALMRERGKVVSGSFREGHNVFTTNGRNWLSKLTAWSVVSTTDVPYTNRRVRWIGIGSGSQLEASNVSGLLVPVLVTPTNYLSPIDGVEFPSSTSVQFIKEFALNEITLTGVPVQIEELGLFADVNPAAPGNPTDGVEDVAANPGLIDSVLDPTSGTNPPIAYKSFEALTKTVDFTLEIRWELRFV